VSAEPSQVLDDRRKRLVYRWAHRGMKEIDAIVGGFVTRNAADLSDADVDALEALLDEPDNDVLAWVVAREPTPERHDSAVMHRLIAVGSGSDSGTGAETGQESA
jgi:antitoxin CptB